MTIYSVQHWFEADSATDGWVTGRGHFTTDIGDARAQLRQSEREHPNVQFRIATAVADWAEVL